MQNTPHEQQLSMRKNRWSFGPGRAWAYHKVVTVPWSIQSKPASDGEAAHQSTARALQEIIPKREMTRCRGFSQEKKQAHLVYVFSDYQTQLGEILSFSDRILRIRREAYVSRPGTVRAHVRSDLNAQRCPIVIQSLKRLHPDGCQSGD